MTAQHRASIVLVVGFILAEGAVFARMPFNPDGLFANSAIQQVSVSPTGDWIVALAAYGDAWGVIAQRRGDGVSIPLYSTDIKIFYLQWVGNDSLFVRHSQEHTRRAALIRLEWNGATIVHDELALTRKGYLVDALTEEDEVVLWASSFRNRSTIARGPIVALASGHWRFSGEDAVGELETVVELDEFVGDWLVDRTGVVRAALMHKGVRDPTWVLKYRRAQGKRWRVVWQARDADDTMYPLAMAGDDQRMIVATHGGGDTLGIYEFDPESKELGRAIFARPNVDVIDAVFDYNGREMIAAVYMNAGQRRYHYLNGFRERHLQGIEDPAPGQSVSVTSTSRNHRFLSLLVQGARNPGSYYFFDKQTGSRTTLGSVFPGIPRAPLVDIEKIAVVSPDGTEIEAFLALPQVTDGRPPPLLVLPHGGPISVQDDRSFDPLLQFIAIDGFAVLKVNYRGSSGYGKTFLEAGKREWARGIEDDIDAAIQTTIDRGLVDPERICIAGMSYGGYSALMSAILRPERYRCAATLNGPTDVPLIFQSTDSAATEDGREWWSEVIGDPDTEFDHLVEISPVYNVERLQVPVLIAHGTRDRRVDPDHAYRLRAMMDVYGKPYEWLVLRDTGHSPAPNEMRIFARRLRAFLRKHLGDQPRATTSDP